MLLPKDWIPLGVFAQPHGVSGRIKVKSLADGVDDFAHTPALTDESGKPIKLHITGHTQGMAIVEIEGITKREQAELLRGKKIGTARAALPKLENANRFYIRDLIGLQATTAEGATFGEVTDVVNYGAGDILVIANADGETELFAFTHATFPEVDIAARRLVIHPPEVLDTRA